MTFKTKYLSIAIFILTICPTLNAQQGKVNVSQDSDIDKLLEYKKDVKTNEVYKIQIFDSTDPDKAQREKDNFLNTYDEWPIEIVWSTPNYKVWVGNFATQLETDRALQKIKKNYMYAFPFQPKSDKK
ncbi:MAG: SPOR domain-containing protein [Winogradskyella sp.]|nr:SPOR domain-containing protein [Winogradskyella sp.]